MISQNALDSHNLTLCPAGSVVLSSRAPIGHLGIASVPLCTNQGCKTLVPLAEELPAADDVPEAARQRRLRAWLREALRRLTGDQQQVLALRFGQGMSAAETARALGKTEESIRALQHRALHALRRLMEEASP